MELSDSHMCVCYTILPLLKIALVSVIAYLCVLCIFSFSSFSCKHIILFRKETQGVKSFKSGCYQSQPEFWPFPAVSNYFPDINECGPPLYVSCGSFADCHNVEGSHHCECTSGYELRSGGTKFKSEKNTCQGKQFPMSHVPSICLHSHPVNNEDCFGIVVPRSQSPGKSTPGSLKTHSSHFLFLFRFTPH